VIDRGDLSSARLDPERPQRAAAASAPTHGLGHRRSRQVHGLDWLYVADGRPVPGFLGVNPYFTIMRLADRVAESLRDRCVAANGGARKPNRR